MLRPMKKVSGVPNSTGKVPVGSPSQSPNPTLTPRDSSNGSTGTPPSPHAAPASAFPVDVQPEPKRGPGRPPKTESATLAKPEEKFSVSDATVAGLIGLVSNLAAYGFSLSTGAPVETLGKVWTFSQGETAMLAPIGAELINKSAPEWLKKYETEVRLALILTPILVAKLAMTHAVVTAYKEKTKKETSSPATETGSTGTPSRAAA